MLDFSMKVDTILSFLLGTFFCFLGCTMGCFPLSRFLRNSVRVIVHYSVFIVESMVLVLFHLCSELYLIFGPLCEGMFRTLGRFLPSFSSTCSTSGLVIKPVYWPPCSFSGLTTLAAFPFLKGPFFFPECCCCCCCCCGSCSTFWLLHFLSCFCGKHINFDNLI